MTTTTRYGDYAVHPLADKFPLIEGQEFDDLVMSIKIDGLKDPISVTADGKTLIDGRNRYRACAQASVQPKVERLGVMTDDEIISFIVAKNMRRRQLTTADRAFLAVEVEKAYAAVRPHGGDRRSVDFQEGVSAFLNGRSAKSPQSIESAAADMGVGATSAKIAKRITKAVEDGIPGAEQIMADTKAGTTSLPAADKKLKQVQEAMQPGSRQGRKKTNHADILRRTVENFVLDVNHLNSVLEFDQVEASREQLNQWISDMEATLPKIRKFINLVKGIESK